VGFTGLAAANDWARLYVNVSLITCESAEALDDLLANTTLGRFVVQRLSDCAVVVDGQQKSQITRALGRRSQSFRIVDLPLVAPETLGRDLLP
jgi:hypothetical protein